MFCVVFCTLFFSFFFWPLYCLSYCTFSFGHYIVCPIVLFLLVILLSVLLYFFFWSFYCLSYSIYGFWLPLWYLKMFLVINWVYIYHFLPTTGDPFIETRAPLPVLCSISPSTVIELWHVMLTNNSFCRFLRKI